MLKPFSRETFIGKFIAKKTSAVKVTFRLDNEYKFSRNWNCNNSPEIKSAFWNLIAFAVITASRVGSACCLNSWAITWDLKSLMPAKLSSKNSFSCLKAVHLHFHHGTKHNSELFFNEVSMFLQSLLNWQFELFLSFNPRWQFLRIHQGSTCCAKALD